MIDLKPVAGKTRCWHRHWRGILSALTMAGFATTLKEAGYVGEDVGRKQSFQSCCNSSEYNVKRRSAGIVLYLRVDKITRKFRNPSIT